MALVVCAGSAVFAVIDATLVRSLPFPRGSELAQIYTLPPDVSDASGANPLHALDLVRLRQHLTVAQGPAGIDTSERGIGGVGDPESVSAAAVSADWFGILGVPPSLGRTFSEEEDVAGAAVVVISHRLWQARFGGGRDVIGARLEIDRRQHEVIGVMPERFDSVYERPDLWTPLGIHSGNMPRPTATYINNVVRLDPDASFDQLAAEVRSIMAEVVAESPASHAGWSAHVRPLREALYGEQRVPLLMLLGGVLALALIAVSNLANLEIARLSARQTDRALRKALGAGTWDLVRPDLARGLLVAATGATAGLILAANLLPLLLTLNPQLTLPEDSARIDPRVGLAAAVLALLTSLIPTAVVHLRQVGRGAEASGLTAGSRRVVASSPLLQFAMVTSQTAISLALLASAFLLFAAFARVVRVDVGYDASGVLGTQLRLSELEYATLESRVTLLEGVLEAVRASPGVVDAGSTMNLLVPGFSYITLIEPADPPPPGSTGHTVQFRRISDGYFRTMRIPLLAGRDFAPADRTGSELVAIVNRTFADRFWDGEVPIGRRIRRGPGFSDVLKVVGVAGDIRDVQVGDAVQPMLYVPYRQNNNASTPISLIVRTSGAPESIARTVAQAVWSVDRGQPLSDTRPLTQFLDDSVGPQRFAGVLLGVFAGLGLVLAALGMVGVTARSIVERTREIGVRTALGGQPPAIWWTVARRPLAAIALGALAGAGLAYGAARLLTANLAHVQGFSPVTGWPGGILLLVVAALAVGVPAHRATRIDPVVALRSE